jgi:hypothetical protein
MKLCNENIAIGTSLMHWQNETKTSQQNILTMLKTNAWLKKKKSKLSNKWKVGKRHNLYTSFNKPKN